MATSKLNFVIAIFTFAFLIQAVHSNFSSESDDDTNQQKNESSSNQDENVDVPFDDLYTTVGNISSKKSNHIPYNTNKFSYTPNANYDPKSSKFYYAGTEKGVAIDTDEEEEEESTNVSSDDDSYFDVPTTQRYREELPNDWEASTSSNFSAMSIQNQKSSQLSTIKELQKQIEETQRRIRNNECIVILTKDGYGNASGEMNWYVFQNRKTNKMSDLTQRYINALAKADFTIKFKKNFPTTYPSPSEFCDEESRRPSDSGFKIWN